MEITITPHEKGHTRIHRVLSDRECAAYECGFAVRKDDKHVVNFASETGKKWALAQNDFSYCRVEGTAGEVIPADPNTNLLYSKTVIPAVKYGICKGEQELVTEVTAWVDSTQEQVL